MPFDGSGNFNRVMNWVNDAAALIKIRADRHDSEDDNFAAGLSNTLTKDGQSQPTANIPMNGKRIVNLAAPVNPTDAATKAYADAVRNFSTAISLTGAVPEARIGFTMADIGFGARVAGTPGGSLSRFVWNSSPDLSGTDVMVLEDTGKLIITAGFTAGGPITTSGALTAAGLLTLTGTGNGISFAEIDARLRARTGPNRLALNDKADGTGVDVWAIEKDGKLGLAHRILLSGLEAAGVSKAFVGFGEVDLSLVARKAGSGLANRVVLNNKADGTGTDLFDFNDALQASKDGVIKAAGYTMTPNASPDAVTAGAYTPTPVGGNLRQVNAVAGNWTFNAPTFTGNYTMVVLINNSVATGTVTFAGFNRVSGGTHPTAINKMSLVYITKVGAAKTAYVEALP